MLFRTGRTRLVDGSDPIAKVCENCDNESEMRLHVMKHGPGIGIPILMWFSDRFVLSSKKTGYLCPICDAFMEV